MKATRGGAIAAALAAPILLGACGGGGDGDQAPSAQEAVACLQDAGVAARQSTSDTEFSGNTATVLIATKGSNIPLLVGFFDNPDDAAKAAEPLQDSGTRVGDHVLIVDPARSAGPSLIGQIKTCVG